MEKTTDTDLSAEGDLEAETWLREHGNYLFRYALATLRDRCLAEDAVQECLLAALQARARFSGKSSVRTWLTGILKHKIVDLVRQRVREEAVDDIELLNDPAAEFESCFDASGHWAMELREWSDPVAVFERKRFWQVMQYCLEQMPRRLAQLFTLREIVGTESEAICQEMGITPTNLWTLLYRSRMNLRRCLDRHWAGEGGGAC